MTNVFISYVRENKDIVDKLASDLTSYDIKVWIDRNEINPGVFWKTAIRQAISQGDFFIACFSSEYNSRVVTYMNEELTLAIDELRKRSTDRAWFIPILLSGVIPDREISATSTLRDLQATDMSEMNWENGIRRIIQVIRPDLHKTEVRVQRLQSLLSSTDVSDRAYAATELRNVGQNEAVPLLIKLLDDQDYEVRRAAVESIGQIGSAAQEAVPALIDLLRNSDRDIRFGITPAIALAGIGKPAISHLVKLLENASMIVRLYAVNSLGRIGAQFEDTTVLSKLITMTEDKAAEVRQATVQALGKLHVNSTLVIPTLTKTLKDESSSVRYLSAQALAGLGSDARHAIGSIMEGLRDPDTMTRFWCITALLRSDTFSPEAILVLQDMAEKDHPMVREAASRALRNIKERQEHGNRTLTKDE